MYREIVFGKIRDKCQELLTRLKKKELSLVLAVSGGLDSSALLHAFSEVSKVQKNIKISVAHVNHKLRPTSDADQNFVQDRTSHYGLDFFTVNLAAKDQGRSTEEWAREKRYQFLESVRLNQAADLVVTAHNLNDQAETLLSRLLTGRLLTQAGCIAEYDQERKLFRPALDLSRTELSAYCSELEIPFVEDPSNQDQYYLRNFIRHELLTLIRNKINPQVDSALSEFVARMHADEALINSYSDEILAKIPSVNALTRSDLLALPKALQWRVLTCTWARAILRRLISPPCSLIRQVRVTN